MITNHTNERHSDCCHGRIFFGGLIISLALLLSACGSIDNSGIEIQPVQTLQPTPTYTPLPTKNPILMQTQTVITSIPTLGIGSTMISDKDGAVLAYVPEGEFLMGANYEPSPDDQSPSYSDNQPQHSVSLDAFWIDQTEVTNRQYALCVSAGECALPLSLKSPMRSTYYDDPQFENYPVIYVEWGMAKTYCEWVGRRLPTEAEWEKAARGTDGRAYPWGNNPPNDNLLNYNSLERDTTEVGKYPQGQSPFGVYDLAGNVWEWGSDWFGWTYYQSSPSSNPPGPEAGSPETGGVRVLRGGSWYYREGSPRSIFRFGVIPVNDLVRSDIRSWMLPIYADTNIYGKPPLGLGTVGFRCAMSAVP